MTLPPDLAAHGYKLIVRTPDRMFAVSKSWGCTGTKSTLNDVIKEARSLLHALRWMSEKGMR
jgi:hypothetical protein